MIWVIFSQICKTYLIYHIIINTSPRFPIHPMEVPGSLYLECPKCGEETLHQVLKGRTGKGSKTLLTATVQCSQCEHVRKEVVRGEKKKKVRLIISHRESSKKDTVEFPVDDVLRVGDVFFYEEYDVLITGIETEKARVGRAGVDKIKTLWVKRFDYVDLKVSIKEGERTRSFKIECDPGDEFNVGDDILIHESKYIIDRVRIKNLTILKPGRGAFAHEIKRVYVKKPPEKKRYRGGYRKGRGRRPRR